MSLGRYHRYQSSHISWQGDVPAHWRRSALKYLGCYQNGYPFKPEDWGTEGLPIIRIAQLSSDVEPNLYAGELDPRVKVADGDLLFSWSATIDSYIWNGGPSWLNQHIFKVTPTDEADRAFLFYLIKHVAPKLADFDAHGSTMRHIKKESLGEPVFIPPLEEQATIAAFLDRETAKIDALVAEQRRLMELLKEKRQAVISHAVTKGLNPNAPMKASGVEWLGEVPAHWEVARLASLFREVVEEGSEELPILSVSIHTGVSDDEVPEEDLERKVSRSDDRSKYKRVAAGDLVYNMMRAWQGGFGTVTVQGQISPAYVVARPTTEVATHFIECLLRTPQAIEQMRRHSRGITDFRLRLYWDEFKNIRVAIPPSEEVSAILTAISAETQRTQELTQQCELSIQLLQERRSALISAAVTGQIDVRHLAPAEAA